LSNEAVNERTWERIRDEIDKSNTSKEAGEAGERVGSCTGKVSQRILNVLRSDTKRSSQRRKGREKGISAQEKDRSLNGTNKINVRKVYTAIIVKKTVINSRKRKHGRKKGMLKRECRRKKISSGRDSSHSEAVANLKNQIGPEGVTIKKVGMRTSSSSSARKLAPYAIEVDLFELKKKKPRGEASSKAWLARGSE